MQRRATTFENPPVGFSGLRPDLPVTIYRRHLPHWRQAGATYFVTFRMRDAIPAPRLQQMQAERDAWLDAHPAPTPDEWLEFQRLAFVALDRWLDAGHGACTLADPGAQAVLAHRLALFDGVQYQLGACVLMPNHVHVVVKPLPDASAPGAGAQWHKLESIVGAWKRRSAREIGTGAAGSLWQDETFDRLVRDTSELRSTVAYLADNPVRAGLAAPFWVRPDWQTWWGRPS